MAAGADYVQQGVDNLLAVVLGGPGARLGRGNTAADLGPLGVGQSEGTQLSCIHATRLGLFFLTSTKEPEMAYQIQEKIGDGGYGHVYKGRDDSLDRDVAIKFIRVDINDSTFTQEQAKALSRCNSANVVTIFSLEELKDPAANALRPALVMELLPGETVRSLTTRGPLSLEDVRRIGLGTIDGLDSIHKAGMVHGDLSLDNVMASPDSVKIIDIHYKHTLAGADAASRDLLRLDDRNSLRSLLTRLIRSAKPTQADVFAMSLKPESSIEDIRNAFDAATDPKLIIDISYSVEYFLKLVNEPSFDNSDEYASALSEEILDAVVRPFLEALISNGGIPIGRGSFVNNLWNRLDLGDRKIIGAELSKAITREVPDGSYGPYLRMAYAFGKTGWSSLTKLCRLRLEHTIVDDVRKGRHDIFNPNEVRGALGTWAILFYQYFSKPEDLLETIITLLSNNWYSQNYVGEHFLRYLPRMVKKPDDRGRLIDGLVEAVKNDAKRIKINLHKLPKEWRTDIEARVNSTGDPNDEDES